VSGPLTARFGRFRADGVELSRRGVELSARAGEAVRAPAAGRVRFVGRLRGAGWTIVLDHGAYATVLSRLAAPTLAPGAEIERGATVATAEGRRVALEVRLTGGDPVGVPIDPAPLLAP
jgi:septal ring factor EnvC (AmiA/AmiB activator)